MVELNNFTTDLLPQPNERTNMPIDVDGNDVGLLVMPIPIAGQTHCFIPGVKRIDAQGNHNVLVDVRDRNGDRILDKKVAWREWFGGGQKELVINKPPNEINDLPLFTNMKVFVDGVMDEDLPTGGVTDLTTKVADDELGTWGHQLYVVCFWERPVSELPDPPPNAKPVSADFTFTPSTPKVGEKIQFKNTSENSVRIEWNIAGNIVGNINEPSFTPQFSGILNIELTAFGADGSSNKKSRTINVLPNTEPLPPPDQPLPEPKIIGTREMVIYAGLDESISQFRLLEDDIYDDMPNKSGDIVGAEIWHIQLSEIERMVAKAKQFGKSFITLAMPVEKFGRLTDE